MINSLIGRISFIYAILPDWVKRFLFLPLIIYDIIYIKVNSRNSKILEYILKIAFNLIITRPVQIKEEIKNLLLILDKVKPKVILEIGTAGGGTLFLFSNIAHEEATLISVDLYQPTTKRILFRYIKKESRKFI